MTDNTKLDWTQPIEAVHEDGRVVASSIVENDGGNMPWLVKLKGVSLDLWSLPDGTTGTSWRIRNVPPATQTQTLTAQERLERMEALHARMFKLVQNMANDHYDLPRHTADEARALVAGMEPVVDGDVIAVRKIMHAQQRAMTPPDSGWGNMSYLKGSYDHTEPFKAALAAYREQRP